MEKCYKDYPEVIFDKGNEKLIIEDIGIGDSNCIQLIYTTYKGNKETIKNMQIGVANRYSYFVDDKIIFRPITILSDDSIKDDDFNEFIIKLTNIERDKFLKNIQEIENIMKKEVFKFLSCDFKNKCANLGYLCESCLNNENKKFKSYFKSKED